MNILTIPLLTAAAASSLSAATFVIGDGFSLNGTGSFGSDPLDNPEVSPGTSGRDNSINNAEFSTLINLDGGSVDGFGSPNDGFDPFVVGQINFRNDIFRSGSRFDLSGIAPAPEGFRYVVTSIELFVEVSGATFTNGIENAGDSVTVGFFAGVGIGSDALVGAPDASLTLNNSDQSTINFDPGNTPFVSVSFDTSLIDLNSDTVFEVVFDAGSNPDTAAVFGSSLAPGEGIGGTLNVEVAPALRITTDLVAIPEPSSALMASLAGFLLAFHRRRQA